MSFVSYVSPIDVLSFNDQSPKLDRLIDETQMAVENTRSFLANLGVSDGPQACYLQNLCDGFERDLRRLLEARRDSLRGQPRGDEQHAMRFAP